MKVDDLLIDGLYTHDQVVPGGWEGGFSHYAMAYAYLSQPRAIEKREFSKD